MDTETIENERFRDMAKAYVQGVRNSDPLQREAIEDGRLSSEDMIDRMEIYYREMAKANESENKEAPASAVEALVSLLEQEVDEVENKIKENKKSDLEDRMQINADSELVDCLNYIIEHFKEKAG